jgi:hypothetical protein
MKTNSGKYLIAFLDLLGTTERLKNQETSSDMIQVAYCMAQNANISEHRVILPCKVYTFSDNIALCAKIINENELQNSLEGLAHIVADMIWMNAGMPSCVSSNGNGFMTPVRGAICYGDLCIDKEVIFLMGEALVSAYELENETAKVPRVILCEQLEKYLPETDIFTKDEDGYYFVDYLRYKCSDQSIIAYEIIKIHTELIKTELRQCVGDIVKYEKILAKYIWLAKYYNGFITQHAPFYDQYKINLDEFM